MGIFDVTKLHDNPSNSSWDLSGRPETVGAINDSKAVGGLSLSTQVPLRSRRKTVPLQQMISCSMWQNYFLSPRRQQRPKNTFFSRTERKQRWKLVWGVRKKVKQVLNLIKTVMSFKSTNNTGLIELAAKTDSRFLTWKNYMNSAHTHSLGVRKRHLRKGGLHPTTFMIICFCLTDKLQHNWCWGSTCGRVRVTGDQTPAWGVHMPPQSPSEILSNSNWH